MDPNVSFPQYKETTFDLIKLGVVVPEAYIIQEAMVGVRTLLVLESEGCYLRTQMRNNISATLFGITEESGLDFCGTEIDCHLVEGVLCAHDCSRYLRSDIRYLPAYLRYEILAMRIVPFVPGLRLNRQNKDTDLEKKSAELRPSGLILKDLESIYANESTPWIRIRKRLQFPAFVSNVNQKFAEFAIIDETGSKVTIAESHSVGVGLLKKILKNPEEYCGKVWEIRVYQKYFDGYLYKKCTLKRERTDKHFTSCLFDPIRSTRK